MMEVLRSIDFTPLFNAIVTIIGVIITGYLVPLLKTKLNAEQLERAKKIAKTGAQAAEMLFGTDEGAAKKAWVIEYLSKYNITLSPEQIDAVIEAVVYELNK